MLIAKSLGGFFSKARPIGRGWSSYLLGLQVTAGTSADATNETRPCRFYSSSNSRYIEKEQFAFRKSTVRCVCKPFKTKDNGNFTLKPKSSQAGM
jgi:hypothetical protein